MNLLRSKGFWASIRIQPLISLEEAKELCKVIDGKANYVTIEHLKIPADNLFIKSKFKDILELYPYKRISNMRNLELPTEIKEDNINFLKQFLPNTPIGCGDNDLHWKSESRCCCGIDTIGKYFENYPKYNLTYFATGSIEEIQNISTPTSKVGSILNSDSILFERTDWKSYVDYYCHKKYKFFGNNDMQQYWKNKDCSDLILKKHK